jgi:hypothetical protein
LIPASAAACRARPPGAAGVAADQGAVVDGQLLAVGQLAGDRRVADADVRAASFSPASGLLHDRAGDVDRDGEADAVAVGGDRGVDADDVAVASSSGPPELPGLIAASVWMRLLSDSVLVLIERPLADTMPLVTEFV